MTQDYIGVDLSKDWLDVCDLAQGTEYRVKNTPRAVRAWLWREYFWQDEAGVQEVFGCLKPGGNGANRVIAPRTQNARRCGGR